MCRKVKDVKDEDINRLKEKYKDVLSGRLEMNHHKISNFVTLIIPVLAEQYKDQTNVRYNCLFSDCIPFNRSYITKQKYIQHLCLKHPHQLPGQGIFLLNSDSNIRFGGFNCEKCGRNFKRKDHFFNHSRNIDCKKEKANESNENGKINKELKSAEEKGEEINLDDSIIVLD